jgi:hypothetical protein
MNISSLFRFLLIIGFFAVPALHASQREVQELKKSVSYKQMKFFANLFTAVAHRNVPMARSLINAGFNVNIGLGYGHTPLFLAVHNGDVDMVRLLVGAHAQVNVIDNKGCTPLSIAAKDNFKEIVHLLIRAGADVQMAANVLQKNNNFDALKILELYETPLKTTTGECALCAQEDVSLYDMPCCNVDPLCGGCIGKLPAVQCSYCKADITRFVARVMERCPSLQTQLHSTTQLPDFNARGMTEQQVAIARLLYPIVYHRLENCFAAGDMHDLAMRFAKEFVTVLETGSQEKLQELQLRLAQELEELYDDPIEINGQEIPIIDFAGTIVTEIMQKFNALTNSVALMVHQIVTSGIPASSSSTAA